MAGTGRLVTGNDGVTHEAEPDRPRVAPLSDAPRPGADPFGVAARAPVPSPEPDSAAAAEPAIVAPAVWMDQTVLWPGWLRDVAIPLARERRPDLTPVDFDSLASEALAQLPDGVYGEAINTAYQAWLATHPELDPAATPDDLRAPQRAWRAFYRAVVATQGRPLVASAGIIAEAILVHLGARRPMPRPRKRPGRKPREETRLRGEITAARQRLAARGVRRPTQEQIAEEVGIGVRTLGHWLEDFPDLRRDLP